MLIIHRTRGDEETRRGELCSSRPSGPRWRSARCCCFSRLIPQSEIVELVGSADAEDQDELAHSLGSELTARGIGRLWHVELVRAVSVLPPKNCHTRCGSLEFDRIFIWKGEMTMMRAEN